MRYNSPYSTAFFLRGGSPDYSLRAVIAKVPHVILVRVRGRRNFLVGCLWRSHVWSMTSSGGTSERKAAARKAQPGLRAHDEASLACFWRVVRLSSGQQQQQQQCLLPADALNSVSRL